MIYECDRDTSFVNLASYATAWRGQGLDYLIRN